MNAEKPFRSESARLLRPNRKLLAVATTPILLGLACVVAAIGSGQGMLASPMIPLAIIAVIGLVLANRSNLDPVEAGSTIEADAAGLRVDRRVVAPRARMTGAFVNPGRPVRVRVTRAGLLPPLVVRVRDIDEGRALVRALGFDATQRVADVRAASQMLAWPLKRQLLAIAAPLFSALGLFVVTMAISNAPWFTAVPAVTIAVSITAALAMATTKTRVRVGADGVSTSWLGRDAFHSFGDVESVETYTREQAGKMMLGVELRLKDGARAVIPCGQEDWAVTEPAELAERISEALEAFRSSGAALAPELLVRRGRPMAAWIRTLRAIGAGANADARTAPVDARDLLRIAEDASAGPATRAAAAIAAVPELGDAARTRIRVAAEATVSPSLRVALERIASDVADDRAIEEALAELEKKQDESDLSPKRAPT